MSTFTTMHTTVGEEALIPKLAIHAFHQAFESAHSTAEAVVYVENKKLLQKQENGDIVVLKDLAMAYLAPKSKHTVLKRKRKMAALG